MSVLQQGSFAFPVLALDDQTAPIAGAKLYDRVPRSYDIRKRQHCCFDGLVVMRPTTLSGFRTNALNGMSRGKCNVHHFSRRWDQSAGRAMPAAFDTRVASNRRKPRHWL